MHDTTAFETLVNVAVIAAGYVTSKSLEVLPDLTSNLYRIPGGDAGINSDEFPSPNSPTSAAYPFSKKRSRDCLDSRASKKQRVSRVQFSECSKLHDGLSKTNAIVDDLVWDFFVKNHVISFEDVMARAEYNLQQTCKIALLLRDCKRRLEVRGLAVVLPRGGGSGARLDSQHLPALAQLYAVVCTAARRLVPLQAHQAKCHVSMNTNLAGCALNAE
jgi:hypothetical protein